MTPWPQWLDQPGPAVLPSGRPVVVGQREESWVTVELHSGVRVTIDQDDDNSSLQLSLHRARCALDGPTATRPYHCEVAVYYDRAFPGVDGLQIVDVPTTRHALDCPGCRRHVDRLAWAGWYRPDMVPSLLDVLASLPVQQFASMLGRQAVALWRGRVDEVGRALIEAVTDGDVELSDSVTLPVVERISLYPLPSEEPKTLTLAISPDDLKAVLRLDHQLIKLRASAIADAVGDLVRAVLGLCRGDQEAVVHWPEEPGLTMWTLRRRATVLDMELFVDDPVRVGPRVAVDRGFLLLDIAAMVEACAVKIREGLGISRYEAIWPHPFPDVELRELSLRVAELRTQRMTSERPPIMVDLRLREQGVGEAHLSIGDDVSTVGFDLESAQFESDEIDPVRSILVALRSLIEGETDTRVSWFDWNDLIECRLDRAGGEVIAQRWRTSALDGGPPVPEGQSVTLPLAGLAKAVVEGVSMLLDHHDEDGYRALTRGRPRPLPELADLALAVDGGTSPS